jgi:hypothetical protein
MGHDPEATERGISGRGPLSFFVPNEGGHLLPDDVQAAATRAIRAILDEAYAEASRTLVEHMETLRRLAAWLVVHERVDGPTFDDLFEGRLAVPTSADEWRAATSRPRAWGDVIDLAGRRNTRPSLPDAAALAAVPVAAATTPGEANGEPLPTLPVAASSGGPAGVLATGISSAGIDDAMAATSSDAASDRAASDLEAAPAPRRGRFRSSRGRSRLRTGRRAAFTRFVRDTLANGLRGAEGRIRPRPSNEGQS